MFRKRFILFTIISIFFILATSARATASNIQGLSQLELAEKYAPVLYFHDEEIFRPQPIEVLLNEARLRKNRNNWFDINLLNAVSLSDLIGLNDAEVFLDVWYGAAGESDYKNFSAHRAYYQENLSPEFGGLPVSAYARVYEDVVKQKFVIQYWLFYYYNDWFNKHEGDWELVQVVLDINLNPEWVILSQHHGGTRRAWRDTQVQDGTHPEVFVALGSHANYFWGDEIYPNGMDIGNSRVEILDRTGSNGMVLPQILMMPESLMGQSAKDADWLDFAGNWGESAFQSDFGGPTGPAEKGLQWEDPHAWGIDQPLDFETWYRNRFKLAVEDAEEITINILQGDETYEVEIDRGEGYLILHSDLAKSSDWIFDINASFTESTKLNLYWPVIDEEVVRKYQFSGIPVEGDSHIFLEVSGTDEPLIRLKNGDVAKPNSMEIFSATWDSPDLVWFAGYLTTAQVLAGVLISLAAGFLPSLLYIFLVYRFDKNEKEPKSLVMTAFVWGAIPAVVVALVVNIFFQVPPDLVGPQALEAVQIGVFSPFVEELLKGMIVLVIALRYRKDFNNILDGIVYGAIVGLGFAMTGNIISYLVTFLFRGFASLQLTFLVEGLLFGLNHAFYTALFGAGLGYALSRRRRGASVWVPFFTVLLAVLANGVHGYVTEVMIGLTPLTIFVNWLGIGVLLVIMILSIRREDEVIRQQLKEELPEQVYSVLTAMETRRAFLKMVKRNFGRKRYKAVQNQFNLLAKLAFLKDQMRRSKSPDLQKKLGDEITEIKGTIQLAELPVEIFDSE